MRIPGETPITDVPAEAEFVQVLENDLNSVGATPPASRHRPAFSVRVTVPKAALTRPEVLVTTEHITVSEFR